MQHSFKIYPDLKIKSSTLQMCLLECLTHILDLRYCYTIISLSQYHLNVLFLNMMETCMEINLLKNMIICVNPSCLPLFLPSSFSLYDSLRHQWPVSHYPKFVLKCAFRKIYIFVKSCILRHKLCPVNSLCTLVVITIILNI